MRALVFEPRVMGGGHYFHYAAFLLESLASIGVDPVLLCQPATKSDPGFRAHIESFSGGDMQVISGVPGAARRCASWRERSIACRALRQTIVEQSIDWLYIPTADGLVQHLAMERLMGRRLPDRLMGFEALVLSGRSAYPGPFGVRARAFASLQLARRAGCTALHWLDPVCASKLSQPQLAMPEPVEPMLPTDRAAAREAVGLPADKTIVTLPGKQDVRKGTDWVADALEQWSSRDPILVHVVGSISPALRLRFETIVACNDRLSLRIDDAYVDDDTLHQSLAAANVVVLPYRTPFQSSGMAIRAALLGTTLVTPKLGWLGMMTARFSLGVATDVDDAKSLADAIESALSFEGADAESREFLSQFHCADNAREHWLAQARSYLALPAEPITTWVLPTQSEGWAAEPQSGQ